MAKQLTNKQKQTLAKKNNIYKTAIKLFKQYGYDNISVRDICKEAGVTTGSLYNLYENKAAILYCFKEKLTEKSNNPLLENNINIDNPIETIQNYITSILFMFDELGYDMTLKLHTQHNLIWNEKTEGTLLLENFVEKAQQNNTLSKQLNASQTTEAINTIIYGLVYQWCDQNGSYDLLKKSQEILPLLLKSFSN
jgi:AcrR family transcriptional regulator